MNIHFAAARTLAMLGAAPDFVADRMHWPRREIEINQWCKGFQETGGALQRSDAATLGADQSVSGEAR